MSDHTGAGRQVTTREEMAEACATIGPLCANAHPQWDQRRVAAVTSAASQLKRDGELRERLEKRIEEWLKLAPELDRYSDDAAGASALRTCAREVEALLKEFP